MDLEQEKQNRKIIELLAELATLGGETADLPDLSLYGKHALFPEELYSTDMSETEKRTRSKFLILKDFLLAKKLEGCSNATIKLYYDIIFHFIIAIKKDIQDISTSDIRSYLNIYSDSHDITNSSLDNMRRVFSSFFEWLVQEDYIVKNPVKKIKRIKIDKKGIFINEQ